MTASIIINDKAIKVESLIGINILAAKVGEEMPIRFGDKTYVLKIFNNGIQVTKPND